MGHVGETLATFDYFVTFDIPRRSTFWHWLSIVLSGAQTGMIFGLVKILSDYFNELRYLIITAFGGGWATLGALAAVSIPLVTSTCTATLLMEPVAGGSGMTDGVASLNGIVITKLFRPKTYLLRIFGFWVAMSSGLWVGPEAPMIYIGATATQIVGRILSQCSGRNQTAKEEYDSLCSGAAMGAAAAFRAPLTGTVMLMEGFGLLWHHSLVWQTFCGSFIAVVVSATFGSKFTCTFALCSSAPGDFVFPGSWTDGISVVAILCSSVTLGVVKTAFSWATFALAECWRKIPVEWKPLAAITLLFITATATFVAFTGIFVVGASAGFTMVIGAHEEAVRFVLLTQSIPLWLLVIVPVVVYIQLLFLHFTPLVGGIFLPSIFAGACIGRFYADLLGSASPGLVAVCGAASGLVGYFRYPLTVSVLIAEVTSNMFVSIPVMAAVILSKAVADLLSPSVVNIMTASKGYHLLTHVDDKVGMSLRGRTAGDYARPITCVLEGFDLRLLATVLDSNPEQDYFPIVSVDLRVVAGLTRSVAEAALLAGRLPGSLDKPLVVDERMEIVKCHRLVRDNGMKMLVVVSHYNKVFIGVLCREDLTTAITS